MGASNTTAKPPYLCKCGIGFTSERSLNFHRGSRACRLRDPAATRYTCKDCRFTSYYLKTLENHRLIKHNKEFPFSCKCGNKFGSLELLLGHQDSGPCSRLHTCRVCGHIAPTHGQLNRHSRSHSDAKPYVCGCGRAYPRKDSFYRHHRNCKSREPPHVADIGGPSMGSSVADMGKYAPDGYRPHYEFSTYPVSAMSLGHSGSGSVAGVPSSSAGGSGSGPDSVRSSGSLHYNSISDSSVSSNADLQGPLTFRLQKRFSETGQTGQGTHAAHAAHGLLPSLAAAATVMTDQGYPGRRDSLGSLGSIGTPGSLSAGMPAPGSSGQSSHSHSHSHSHPEIPKNIHADTHARMSLSQGQPGQAQAQNQNQNQQTQTPHDSVNPGPGTLSTAGTASSAGASSDQNQNSNPNQNRGSYGHGQSQGQQTILVSQAVQHTPDIMRGFPGFIMPSQPFLTSYLPLMPTQAPISPTSPDMSTSSYVPQYYSGGQAYVLQPQGVMPGSKDDSFNPKGLGLASARKGQFFPSPFSMPVPGGFIEHPPQFSAS